jgi:hypothetical protein
MSNRDEFARHFTAYQTGSANEWTVWDHVKDAAVAEDIPEAQALRMAAELDDDQEAGR